MKERICLNVPSHFTRINTECFRNSQYKITTRQVCPLLDATAKEE